jgi:hypothetical protein
VKESFLIFAVLLNVGFAALVFWWGLRELRRGRAARRDEPPNQSD